MCCGIFKPKISFSTGLRRKKTFRTVEEVVLFKKQTKPKPKPPPTHTAYLCSAFLAT